MTIEIVRKYRAYCDVCGLTKDVEAGSVNEADEYLKTAAEWHVKVVTEYDERIKAKVVRTIRTCPMHNPKD